MIQSRKALLFTISISIMFFGSAMVIHSIQGLFLDSVDIAISLLGGITLTIVLSLAIIKVGKRIRRKKE